MKKISIGLVILIGILTLSIFAAFPMRSIDGRSYPTEEMKSSAGEITIITPENKTYTKAMSGYYPATYGFENDENGANPVGWELEENGGDIDVKNSLGGHSKIVEIIKDGTTNWPYMINTFSTNFVSGTVEFWMRGNDVTQQCLVYIRTSPGALITMGIDNDQFVRSASGGPIQNIVSCNDNTWYHVRIDFECGSGAYEGLSEDHYYIYIDGQRFGEYEFRETGDSMEHMLIYVWETSVVYDFDAIGYSWESNYNIGDNLNEGLLLSYENTTTLDWQAFSLDETANKTIRGNTTLPMPSDGLHSVQVFGNDSIGTIFESNIRYFTVNTAPPDIIINSPTDSQVIGSTAPNYDISIVGPYDSIWYALEGGSNYTASGLTGAFNQAAWTALSDGIIIIDFYANNSAGMEGTAQVMVFKDSSEEPPSGIPGYNLVALIGVCSIITLVIIKKRRGWNKS